MVFAYDCRTQGKENSPNQFFPRAVELRKVEAALHEYLGLLWARVTG